MKYLEHCDEVSALGGLAVLVSTVDWLAWELAAMVAGWL